MSTRLFLALALAAAPSARAQTLDGEALFRAQTGAAVESFRTQWGATVRRISHRDRNGPLQQFQAALEHLVREALPSVVILEDEGGKGSGFVIDKSGIVVTCAHVVDKPDANAEVEVRFKDGRKVKAKIAASDPRRDIAFLRIEPFKGLRALRLGEASTVRPGHLAVAIGSPEGFEFSVSLGIVSAARNSFMSQFPKDSLFVNFFQADAAINNGNSGGPLLAADGTVIGMNSMIYTKGGGSDGLGFAISVEDIKAALSQFKGSGSLQAAGIGVGIHADSENKAGAQGAPVQSVREGSPAHKAGIQPGDAIVELDGRPLPQDPLAAARDYIHRMGRKSPGDVVDIVILRGPTRLRLRMTAEVNKPDPPPEKKEPAPEAHL